MSHEFASGAKVELKAQEALADAKVLQSEDLKKAIDNYLSLQTQLGWADRSVHDDRSEIVNREQQILKVLENLNRPLKASELSQFIAGFAQPMPSISSEQLIS